VGTQFGSIPPHVFPLRNNSIQSQIHYTKIQPRKPRFSRDKINRRHISDHHNATKTHVAQTAQQLAEYQKHRAKPTWQPESAQQFTHNNSRKVPQNTAPKDPVLCKY
jgi:hypothetical protein